MLGSLQPPALGAIDRKIEARLKEDRQNLQALTKKRHSSGSLGFKELTIGLV
jgi:hypothetical protein